MQFLNNLDFKILYTKFKFFIKVILNKYFRYSSVTGCDQIFDKNYDLSNFTKYKPKTGEFLQTVLNKLQNNNNNLKTI